MTPISTDKWPSEEQASVSEVHGQIYENLTLWGKVT